MPSSSPLVILALVLATSGPLVANAADNARDRVAECMKLVEERSEGDTPIDDEYLTCAGILEDARDAMQPSPGKRGDNLPVSSTKESTLAKDLDDCYQKLAVAETALASHGQDSMSVTSSSSDQDGVTVPAPPDSSGNLPIRCDELDYRMAPLFNSTTLETFVVGLVVLVGVCVLGGFMLGGGGGTTPIVTATAELRGLTIAEVIIRPGSEVIIVANHTSADVDMTGCSVRVGEHIFHFDDGYNLARNTKIEVHAGPDARNVKQLPIEDHDKFDSRRCPRLFWTAATVFAGSGETKATLIDPNDQVINESR